MGKLNKASTNAFRKISPYRYPSSKHKRTQNPPKYSVYARYKDVLIEEFGKKCVYCRKVMLPGERSSFCVEHYRPKAAFSDLETEYENLFLACFWCNTHKASYWKDESNLKVLNPCDDVVAQHLSFDSSSIVSRSPRGNANVELFRFNTEDSVAYRKNMSLALKLAIGRLLSISNKKKKTSAEIANIEDLVEHAAVMTGTTTYRIKKILKLS